MTLGSILRHVARRTPRAAVRAVGLVVIVAATAGAAAAGDPFRLGVVNSISGAITRLTGANGGPLLQVANQSPGSGARAAILVSKSATAATLQSRNSGGGPAAQFIVGSSVAPFVVSSDAKVTNLNADRLDGRDADGFVLGPGRLSAGAAAIPRTYPYPVILVNAAESTRAFEVLYICPANQGDFGVVRLVNYLDETVNVFSDNGSADPAYRTLSYLQWWDQVASPTGERITFHIQGSIISVIEIFSVHRGNPHNDCHAQAIALRR